MGSEAPKPRKPRTAAATRTPNAKAARQSSGKQASAKQTSAKQGSARPALLRCAESGRATLSLARRYSWELGGLLALGLLLGVGWWSVRLILPLLERPLTGFEIHNQSVHLSDQEVRQLLAPLKGTSMLTLPLAEWQERLESQPWIRSVELQRRWPGHLQVRLVEELPVARWGDAGLLNHEGEIFWPKLEAAYSALPRLTGPSDSTQQMMGRFQTYSHQLRPLGLKLKALNLEDRGAWTLELDNGVTLLVGRDPVLEKMQRFTRLYPRYLEPRVDKIERVDIRYTNGLAIGWRKPAEQTQQTDRT